MITLLLVPIWQDLPLGLRSSGVKLFPYIATKKKAQADILFSHWGSLEPEHRAGRWHF